MRNACALCGQSDGVPLFRVDGYTIVRCPSCDLVYAETRPAGECDLYDQSYYNSETAKGGYANYFAGSDTNRMTFARRLRSIEQRRGARGRVLDLGCALGDFLSVARSAGWEVQGVELSAWAAEVARRRGLAVHTGSLESAGFAGGSFDVVTLYDVIEHCTDPIALLAEVHRVLAFGGLVHVVTPNVGGLLSRLFGRWWYHYKPGEHLYYFSPTTLTALLRRAGLCVDGCSVTGSVMTFAYALDRLKYYSPTAARATLAVLRTAGLDQRPLYVLAGEMQAWGRRSD